MKPAWRSMRSPAIVTAALVAAVAVAGCAGDHSSGAVAVAPAAGDAPPAAGRFLTQAELVTQLGNGFRQGLYRLAVMSQPGDDAADLGQSLPTGSLREVSCRENEPRPQGSKTWPWTCGVRWQTVDGARTSTRYSVSLDSRGCFFASASPRLPEHYDTTIRTYSEHPLNALQSLRRGC